MIVSVGQQLRLLDGEVHDLGTLLVDCVDGQGVSGQFTTGEDFGFVRDLFNEWIASVNDQLMMEVDRLDAEIAKLELRVRRKDGTEASVADCQPGTGRMSLRLERAVNLNGTATSSLRINSTRV